MSTHERPERPPAGPLALPAAGLRLAAALAARPAVLLRRGGALAVELGRVGLGRSTPAPSDGRPDHDRTGDPSGVSDPTSDRASNRAGDHDSPAVRITAPLRRRALQTWLATVTAVAGVLDDAGEDTDHLPPADAELLRLVLAGLTGPVPTPAPAGRPGEAPAGPGTAGTARTAVPDPATGPEHPEHPHPVAPGPGPGPGDDTGPGPGSGPDTDTDTSTDTGARDAGSGPVRGRDVAATPGAVVLRTPVFELLQYLPATEQVHDAPVLVVPPLVHRYWLADLAPGFSLVEHLLQTGLQVFVLSWRPAGPADAGRDLDAHVTAVLDALDACTRITRVPRASLLGVRAGGLLTAAAQAHLGAIGLGDRVAAAAYLATVLDQAEGFRPEPDALRRAAERAARDGVLDGHEAARALRAWAADLLPLPAALHADLVTLAGAGPAGAAGGTVLGTPVHPAELRRDGYLVAVADDPVQPWSGGHRTAGSFGGACRLVLAPGDQAGALIAPPGAGSSFRVAPCDAGGGTPAGWSAAAEQVTGSWWDDLACWLTARAGALRDAPPELGGRRLRPLFPAPGTYLGPATVVPADVRG